MLEQQAQTSSFLLLLALSSVVLRGCYAVSPSSVEPTPSASPVEPTDPSGISTGALAAAIAVPVVLIIIALCLVDDVIIGVGIALWKRRQMKKSTNSSNRTDAEEPEQQEQEPAAASNTDPSTTVDEHEMRPNYSTFSPT